MPFLTPYPRRNQVSPGNSTLPAFADPLVTRQRRCVTRPLPLMLLWMSMETSILQNRLKTQNRRRCALKYGSFRGRTVCSYVFPID